MTLMPWPFSPAMSASLAKVRMRRSGAKPATRTPVGTLLSSVVSTEPEVSAKLSPL